MKDNFFKKAASLAAGAAVGLALLALPLAVFHSQSRAQVAPGYGGVGPGVWWTGFLYGTNTGAATTKSTNLYLSTAKLTLAGAKDVFVEFTCNLDGAGSGTEVATLVLGRNASGLAGSTNIEQFLTWPVTLNGTTMVTACTNLSSANGFGGGVPNLYLYSLSNTNTAGMTNMTIRVSLK